MARVACFRLACHLSNPPNALIPAQRGAAQRGAARLPVQGDRQLPFISEQKYNVSIKRIFKAAGLKRIVTVLNARTGQEEKRILYEVASSHMARRTFIGNLYKKVKDPNIVGSMSGHKEGSKAFARYREIDEDIKKEVVNLL